MGWGRTRARSLARAGARAAGTGDAALPGSAAPPVGAQRVHSVPQSTRWPRAARSTLRLMRRRTECAPRWQGSEPEQRGRRASIEFSKARSRLRPRGGPCCAGPSAPQPNGGSRRGRPLHALACTRRLRTVAKPFTQFQEIHRRARAPGSNRSIGTGRARPPQLAKHRATRCCAPRASCCPLDTLGAPEAGRARCGSPPSLAPCALRRARSTGSPRICRRRLPRARALQPCNRIGPRALKRRRPASHFAMRCCMLGAQGRPQWSAACSQLLRTAWSPYLCLLSAKHTVK